MYTFRDSQLAQALEDFKQQLPGGIQLDDINAARDFVEKQFAGMLEQQEETTGVTASDHYVSGMDGSPDVKVRLYQPKHRQDILPALLWIHGGGLVLGSIEGEDFSVKEMVQTYQCLCASVEYRLAPEHRFPAAVEDCYTALAWIASHADQLGIDPSRIAVGGASAGGGLAACLSLLTRDRGEINIAFQMLIYPMLDDRNIVQASDEVPDSPIVWTRANNLAAWRAYLGKEPGKDDTSPYAAAARAKDLSGLPPAYIGVGTLDLFCNENFEYARRLTAAGVPTEFHVYAEGFHGFDSFAPESDTARRFIADRNRVIKRALHP